MREHFGPDWRMYFVQRGALLIVMLGGGDTSTQAADIAKAIQLASTYASTPSPCLCTTANNLSAMPLGCLLPVSHFCTVDTLVLRYLANTGWLTRACSRMLLIWLGARVLGTAKQSSPSLPLHCHKHSCQPISYKGLKVFLSLVATPCVFWATFTSPVEIFFTAWSAS